MAWKSGRPTVCPYASQICKFDTQSLAEVELDSVLAQWASAAKSCKHLGVHNAANWHLGLCKTYFDQSRWPRILPQSSNFEQVSAKLRGQVGSH